VREGNAVWEEAEEAGSIALLRRDGASFIAGRFGAFAAFKRLPWRIAQRWLGRRRRLRGKGAQLHEKL